MSDLRTVQSALDRAVIEGVFPGAVLAVQHKGRPVVDFSTGRLSAVPQGPSVTPSTTYDLASLTKPLATVTSLAILVQNGRCRLDDPVAEYLPECADTPIGSATLRHLLTHTSGLPGWRGYYEGLSADGRVPASNRERVVAKQSMLRFIQSEALVYERGTRSLYSDLGFMLLGFIIERCGGQSLSVFFKERVLASLSEPRLAFVLPERVAEFLEAKTKQGGGVAPTEVDPWRGRVLHGEVHDENAAALGGEAGHAGLFGTAGAVLAMTGMWMQAYHGRTSLLDQDLVREFTRRQNQEGSSSWALGWDTPSVPSSSGQYFSARSFGHLGYTGTSVWIDPEAEFEVVLLSNRVHPTRKNDAIRGFRPLIHDLVYREFVSSGQGRSG
ncbi:MAG: beta-lactamase family protein [Nitrospira sp.]|nr:beta-lactamase family protein [Nitrospira sp.]